jgi:hypothetical protein
MASRRSIRRMLVDDPLDSTDTVMTSASSPVPPSQPVTKAGRDGAPRDNLIPSGCGTSAGTTPPTDNRSSKRSRIETPTAASSSSQAEGSRVALNNDAVSGSNAVVLMDDVTAVPSAPHRGDAVTVSSAAAAVVTTSASTSPSLGSASLPSVQGHDTSADGFVAVHVGHDKLLREAGIDNRRTDAVYVDVKVNARFPSCPSIDPLQFRYDAAAKLRFVAMFLGSSQGLGINAPLIPRFLVEDQNPASVAARAQVTAGQHAWLAELSSLASLYGALLCDRRGDDEDKVAACDKLWAHLAQLHCNDGSAQPALWPNAQLTSDWHQILAPRTSILSSQGPAQRTSTASSKSHYTYELVLHGATPEATCIIACAIASFGLMRLVSPQITSAVSKILASADSDSAAESTESSEDDGEWRRQRGRKNRADRVNRRAEQGVRRKFTELAGSPLMIGMDAQYRQHTQLPLLALATKISMRPMLQPYISCIIDNWQSLGCNIHDLENDPIFKQITQSRPQFAHPFAFWAVTQRIGNAVASVWIREEHKELLVQLNSLARTVVPLPQASLRVACTVVRKSKRGRIDYDSAIKIFLTDPTKVNPPVTQQRPSPPPAPSPAPAIVPGSYAARLVEGIRRAAQNSSLNHRPRKSRRANVQSSVTTAPSAHVARLASSAEQEMKQPSPQRASSTSALGVSSTPTSHRTAAAATSSTDTVGGSAALNAQLAGMEARLARQMEARVDLLIQTQMERFEHMIERMSNTLFEQVEIMLRGMAKSTPSWTRLPDERKDDPESKSDHYGRISATTVSQRPLRTDAASSAAAAATGTHDPLASSTTASRSSASASPAQNGQAVSHG